MTKRFFYDCPIKAAYMAKHHGMRFECFFVPIGKMREVTLPALESHIGCGHLQIDKVFYLHPDSVALLREMPVKKVRAIKLVGLWPEQET